MSDKIVLLDGHSILNRAFFGLPDLTNAEGLHTNEMYVGGMSSSLPEDVQLAMYRTVPGLEHCLSLIHI